MQGYRRRDVGKSGKKEKIKITFTTVYVYTKLPLPAREIELESLDNLANKSSFAHSRLDEYPGY